MNELKDSDRRKVLEWTMSVRIKVDVASGKTILRAYVRRDERRLTSLTSRTIGEDVYRASLAKNLMGKRGVLRGKATSFAVD